jgi:hypothetical protein
MRSSFIAFLDTEKVFDTIPHETLLLVMKELQTPLKWVETTRLLLIGNKTNILNQQIIITRGCLQFSHSYPFYAYLC